MQDLQNAVTPSSDQAAVAMKHPEAYLQLLDDCATQEQILREKVEASEKLLNRMGGIASLYSESQSELETILQNLKVHEREFQAQESVLQRQIDASANLMRELQCGLNKATVAGSTAGDERLDKMETQESALREKLAAAEQLMSDLEKHCADGLQGAITTLHSRSEAEMQTILEHLKGHENELQAQEAVLKAKIVNADALLARLESMLPDRQTGGDYAAQLGGEMEAIVSGMRAREDESKAQELLLRDRVVALEGMLAHLEHEVSARMPLTASLAAEANQDIGRAVPPVYIPRKSLSNLDDVAAPRTDDGAEC